MARLTATALAIAAALVALAGCAGDNEPVGGAELVRRADQICEQSRKRFASVQAKAPAKASAAAAQTNELVEIAADELSELREIRPPDELREPYEAYLESRARSLELLELGRDAAEEGDAEAYGAAQSKAAATQPERLKLARALGLEQCSKR